MTNKNPKLMKVYEIHGGEPKMPQEVVDAFFRMNQDTGNDCYVSHYIEEMSEEELEDYTEQDAKDIQLLNNWLLANGSEMDEEVLISHWW